MIMGENGSIFIPVLHSNSDIRDCFTRDNPEAFQKIKRYFPEDFGKIKRF